MAKRKRTIPTGKIKTKRHGQTQLTNTEHRQSLKRAVGTLTENQEWINLLKSLLSLAPLYHCVGAREIWREHILTSHLWDPKPWFLPFNDSDASNNVL